MLDIVKGKVFDRKTKMVEEIEDLKLLCLWMWS